MNQCESNFSSQPTGITSFSSNIADALEWSAALGCERQALQLLSGPMLEYDFLHRDVGGLTFLHHATINKMEDAIKAVVKRLSRYYISVDIPDSFGYTPYLHARTLDHQRIAEILIDAGASTKVEKRQDVDTSTKSDVKPARSRDIVQLKISGRLPQLKRLIAKENRTEREYYNDRNNQFAISNNINSLFQLNPDGETVNAFVNSTTVADVESSDTTTPSEPTLSHRPNSYSNSLTNLNNIFNVVSAQMTKSFCRPAHKLKPKTIVLEKSKLKTSALAAIMKKPLPDRLNLLQNGDQRKSHLKRRVSRMDMSAASTRSQPLPTIKTSLVD